MPKPNEVAEETPLEKLAEEYENTPLEEVEEAPKKVAAVAKEVAAEVEKPKHNPRILRMCKELDISDEEIEGLPTEAVETLISREIRRNKQLAQQQSRQENEIDRRKAEKKEEEEIEWGEIEGEDGKKRKATEDDIHPALVPVLKAQAKKIKELEEQLKGTKKVAESSSQEKFEAAFDASCSRFKKTLGEGRYTELKESGHKKKREVVFTEVLKLVQKDPTIKMDEAIDRCVKELFGVAISKPKKPVVEEDDEEEDEAAKVKSAYTKGKTVRPSGRKGSPQKGVKAAEDAVENWLNENLGEREEEDDPDSEY